MSILSDNMLSIFISCIIILLIIYIRKKLNYFEVRGLPHVKPTFLEFIKSFSLAGLVESPLKIYPQRKEGEEIIGFFHSFFTPVILVLEPNLARNILIKDFSHFQDHGFEFEGADDPLTKHLFNMKGDKWRTLRNKLLPTFTSGKLKGMIPTMVKCSRDVIDEMKQDSNLRQDINLKQLASRYTLDATISCVFAIDPKSVRDPNCEFRRILAKIFPPKMFQAIKMYLMMSFPKLAKLFGVRFADRAVGDFFLKLVSDTLDMRKKSGEKRNDFIQLLLELREKGSVQVDQRDLEEDEMANINEIVDSESTNQKLEMTNDLLTSQAFVFIIGGFDNSAYLTAITVYLISKHKEIQEKIRLEVKDAIAKHGVINYQALKEMKLLDGAINEALRLLLPFPALSRVCTRTYTLDNGMVIEKGTQVMIPSKSFANDERYWSNPQEFNPERYSYDNLKPGTYIPFGDGPRICIAQRLVLLMSKIMIVDLINNFETLPSTKNQEPFKFKYDFTSDAIGGIWGSFKPLKN